METACQAHHKNEEPRHVPMRVCGNDCDKSFTVSAKDGVHIFGSFECALFVLAPTCAHCGCSRIGHGIEDAGVSYCCAHCAKTAGLVEMRDRGA